ncbi:halocyanin domain-containing protein [Halobellus sp. GM3]|uniref:halocyanin domain-containing protein n=1 Tax=Halobellus sp. GM3 TaxID=3458410 RepID=UPI00403DBC02
MTPTTPATTTQTDPTGRADSDAPATAVDGDPSVGTGETNGGTGATSAETSTTDVGKNATSDAETGPSHAAAAAGLSRRAAIRAIGGGVAAAAALGSASASATAQSDGADLESWFENTSNFDGVVDRTDGDAVAVDVGADANGGAFGFGPAAVRVTPGTTVTWSWTGDGGSHDVVDTDGAFQSDLVGEAGHTFEHTFETEGTYTYSCTPHETMGMKGAVVVGESEPGESADGGSGGGSERVAAPFGDDGARELGGLALGGVFGLALASPGLFGAFLWLRERSGADNEPRSE